ncbi:AAA ATPase-like protein [Frischella perrara]|uniref:Endonuclease GajA/Old nuclease/RecF-like AAA domain-containing protein n=1 Tax=Frischella perrara TaxID=1267021 RepID=A0A0A7S589_FRIPE|nr:AAA family ATPase [Frischella perrara]AJA46007.1 Protein of unknown function (DUF3696)/AAA ATPase domain protein [Frischella perrara]PWV61356.1 AAA ATPase-like protein [Frischella perrara]
MLVSLGVENFRSFKKKTNIELKPITVFVGKNSSGKSSFLRLFPLFRQSIEANTTGPILWFGRYVDFGDFNKALYKQAKDKNIKFFFKFIIPPSSSLVYKSIIGDEKETQINIELIVGSDQKKTKYKSINISFNNIKVSITNNDEKGIDYSFYENGNKMFEKTFPDLKLEKLYRSFILPYVNYSISTIGNNHTLLIQKYAFGGIIELISFNEKVEKKLIKYFSPNPEMELIHNFVRNLKLDMLEKDSFLDSLKKSFLNNKTFIENLNNNYDQIYEDIFPSLLFSKINSILTEINYNLNETFSKIRYIAPIRAIAERFYRFQDLQINEMDHTGSNVAMILNSLTQKEKNAFTAWVKKNFNFSISVEESGLHYTINIIDEDNITYNISDMGFGYSQLLPIIMSLWLETEKLTHRRNNELFFVIEQPELHLHPAYQTQLAKLFVNIIAKAPKKLKIKIIVETHSQHFINALGECVEKGKISKDDLSIIIFNKENTETDIQTAYFDEEGTLENWPIGFFSGE